MSTGDLAEKIATEAPWWATAPIWLAAGIVGVPSLIAIGAGYFIVHGVATQMKENENYQHQEIQLIQDLTHTVVNDHADNTGRWEIVRRWLALQIEIQLRQCIHEAETPNDRVDCVAVSQSNLKTLQ